MAEHYGVSPDTVQRPAGRVGTVAKLCRGDFTDTGGQWMLRFEEKGGRARQTPVRGDLQHALAACLNAHDIVRMMKRLLRDASLPGELSPHSFGITVITDLLDQGVPLEDIQRLAGHADLRTTRLYDRRHKKVIRNIVERISI